MPQYTGPKIEAGASYPTTWSLSQADAVTKLFELLLDVADLAASGGGGGVSPTRAINTTSPLSGGGDLSADRTISLQSSAASKLFGRGDSGAGVAQEITLGAGLTMTGTTLSASGSSGGGAGHTEVDFGTFPGAYDTSVAVTGQTGILAGSVVRAWLYPLATADHSADEHLLIARDIEILAGNIVAGTGFTIYALFHSSSPFRLSNADMAQLFGHGLRANSNRGMSAIPQNSTPRLYGRWSVSWQWI